MTRTMENLRLRFEHCREWELNPVVVKELRQAMRNRVLISVLSILMAALFLVSLIILRGRGALIHKAGPAGLQLSQAFLAVLTVVSLVCVPLYAGMRLAIERAHPDFELLFATALPVWKLIRGKFLSAACIQLIFFGVFFPFMAFSAFLEGMDLPTVLFSLVCLYIVVCVAAQAAIAVACLPVHTIGKIAAGLFFAAMLVIASWGLCRFFFGVLESGVGTLLGTAGFWLGCVGFFAVAMWVCLVCYAFAVSMTIKGHLRRNPESVIESLIYPEPRRPRESPRLAPPTLQ